LILPPPNGKTSNLIHAMRRYDKAQPPTRQPRITLLRTVLLGGPFAAADRP